MRADLLSELRRIDSFELGNSRKCALKGGSERLGRPGSAVGRKICFQQQAIGRNLARVLTAAARSEHVFVHRGEAAL